MKKVTNYLYYLAMVGLIVWFSYGKGWIFADFENIEAKQALYLLENDNNISLLDVRGISEYKAGHLEDATLIPVEHLSKNLTMLKDVKNKKILVYCRSGNRSVMASRILKKNGFTPINIKGGMIQLMSAGANIIKK